MEKDGFGRHLMMGMIKMSDMQRLKHSLEALHDQDDMEKPSFMKVK